MAATNPIVETYQQLTTSELLALASEAASLRPDVIPYLRDELQKRNQPDDALVLTNYLIEKPKTYKDLTKDELNELIQEKINNGESIDAIKMDLKDNGIDAFEMLNEESRQLDATFEYIVALKDEGLDDDEIAAKLKAERAMNDDQVTEVNDKLKKQGHLKLIIGYTIVVVFSGLIFTAINNGGSFGLKTILLLGSGFLLIVQGHRQSR